MLGKTHRAFGLTAVTATMWLGYERIHGFVPSPPASRLFTLTQVGITVAAAVIGSTLPDIDQALGTTHRGITHAVWIPLLLAVGARFASSRNFYVFALLFGLFVGYLSHLVGDAFSKAGIAWFYPFQKYDRYGSGAFTVKGFRGPFVPLYSVGNPSFAFMPAVWYILALVFAVLFGRRFF